MQPPPGTEIPPRTAPSFYLIDRQPPRPAAILLAILVAALALSGVALGLGHSRAARLAEEKPAASRPSGTTPDATPPHQEEEKDDPSQVDTIVLGDAADAPVPARRGDHVSDVHATIIVRLPRYGEQTGLIPDTPSGHLLFGWLAAFNQASEPALRTVLPGVAPASSAAAQMDLRQQTGGFNLLSAKEVQPGVLVFRLRDQTPEGNEVLGTLQVRAQSAPASIASLSLRAIPPKARAGQAGTATKPSR